MKKIKMVLIFSALFFCIYLIALYTYKVQIPDIRLTCEGSEINSIKCPFSWSTFFSRKQIDYPTPTELAKTIDAADLKANSIIQISFSKKPDSIEISQWDEKSVKYLPAGQAIGTPSEKGTYVYCVIGYWKQGQVAYIIKADVH